MLVEVIWAFGYSGYIITYKGHSLCYRGDLRSYFYDVLPSEKNKVPNGI